MTTLRQLMTEAKGRLTPIYGESESQWLIRTIMEHLKGWDQVEIAVRANDEVSDFIIGEVNKVVDRLCKNEPIQYIFGDTYWHGMTLKVSPAVLIPRPETSELVDIIVDENKGSDLKVFDICTGSGCIAVALAKSLAFSDVSGCDISDDALRIAEANAAGQKVKVDFFKADALNLATDESVYDIIVSNPPYVMENEKAEMSHNVLDFEPGIALFVPDNDALKFYTAIAAYAEKALKPDGRLYFELNPLTSDELLRQMKQQTWDEVSVLPDMHGKKRFLTARK